MKSKITQGDPGNRQQGLGNIPPPLVRERAAELAAIDGRTEEEITQDDLDRAAGELSAAQDEGRVAAQEPLRDSLEPDEAAQSLPRQETTRDLDPERDDVEKLVEEGIEEAVHDEMVESGRETRRGKAPE